MVSNPENREKGENTMVNATNNTGKRTTPNSSPPGHSILDYSIAGCFALIFLLVILLLDAYEYVTVPGVSSLRGGGRSGTVGPDMSARENGAAMEAMTASATKEDLEEAKREIADAKAIIAKMHAEVETIVGKVEDQAKEEATEAAKDGENPAAVVETPEEKMKEIVKKEDIVETVLEKELGIDKWCGTCIWNNAFACDKRKSWLMEKYGITEVEAKEACAEFCIKK
jgi:hypothetical protein